MPLPLPLIFGTYKLRGDVLEDSASQALVCFQQHGRPQLIDSAAKYINFPTIIKLLKKFPEALFGWKIEAKGKSSALVSDLYRFKATLEDNGISPHRVFRILLHNYYGFKMYIHFQHAVEEVFGATMPIGVCNITAQQLEELVTYTGDKDLSIENCSLHEVKDCDTTSNDPSSSHGSHQEKPRIQYVQNELHPFLETHVPEICAKYSICFEAHSTMTGIEQYRTLFRNVAQLDSRVIIDAVDLCKASSDSISITPAHDNIKALDTIKNEAVTQYLSTLELQSLGQLATAYAAACIQSAYDMSTINSVAHHETTKGRLNPCGSICFSTTNWTHLCEICNAKPLPSRTFNLMKQFIKFDRIVKYKGASTSANIDWIQAADEEYMRRHILPQLLNDIELFDRGEVPSSLCVEIPKPYHRPQGIVHTILARLIYCGGTSSFPNENHQLLQSLAIATHDNQGHSLSEKEIINRLNQKLSGLLTKMRRRYNNAQEAKKRISKQAASVVSAVMNPSALPVDYFPPKEEFQDLNNYLLRGGVCVQACDSEQSSIIVYDVPYKYIESPIMRLPDQQPLEAAAQDSPARTNGNADGLTVRFQHGTINADGRYDLCKQGMRNAFIDTAEAVAQENCYHRMGGRGLIKHYLIGNNRIGEDDVGGKRVAALASLIRCRPDIMTWYLAGNELNAETSQQIAEALIPATGARYIWLKMNPIKTGAYYFGVLLQINPYIELLDLFNCGLCNEGIEAFFQGLRDGAIIHKDEYALTKGITKSFSGLKHLYIPINHISNSESIIKILEVLAPQLESLYIGVNPLGDDGLRAVLVSLMHPAEQFTDEICQNTPDSIINLGKSVSKCYNLLRLNIGSMNLTDASLPLITEFVAATPSLVSVELGSYKSTDYFQQQHNQFSDASALMQLGIALRNNSTMKYEANAVNHFLGLHRALSNKPKAIYPNNSHISNSNNQCWIDVLLDEMEAQGITVNGIQRPFLVESEKRSSGKLVMNQLTQRQLKMITDPIPALDYIHSIYRNNMM